MKFAIGLLWLFCHTASGQALAPAGVGVVADASSLLNSLDAFETEPPSVSIPSYFEFEEFRSDLRRTELGYLETIHESLFGHANSESRWRPLTLRTFFTEGWREGWAKAPAGRDGVTPRQGWLGAFDGVIYRLSLVTTFDYTNGFTTAFGGSRYAGTYSAYLPLSRRFEMLLTVPFLVSNGTSNTKSGYTSQFGDLTITPRFLLSESETISHVFAVAVRTPTGTQATFNEYMALTPRYEFWTNPLGSWVLRGSNGFFVPMNEAKTKGPVAFTGGLAFGRYFRPHDVPFGDLVFYCQTNCAVPLDGTASRDTIVTVGPGARFHITNNFFFLNNWDFPVTSARAGAYSVQFAVLKVF